MDDPAGDRRQLPLLAELQRLRDRGIPHAWRATRQRPGGAAHPALQPMVRRRLRSGAAGRPSATGDARRSHAAITRGFDGPEAPHAGNRGIDRDPARLPVPGRAASAASAGTAADDRRQQPGRRKRTATAAPAEGSPGIGGQTTQPTVPKNVPRLKIDAPRLQGSVSLVGARIDDLILTDYHDTQDPNSPNVRLLEPLSDSQPYYVQYGWTPADRASRSRCRTATRCGRRRPTRSAPGHPVTLSWDNGQGLTFELQLSVDDDYMFNVQQSVKNATGAPVKLFPWARVRRRTAPPGCAPPRASHRPGTRRRAAGRRRYCAGRRPTARITRAMRRA